MTLLEERTQRRSHGKSKFGAGPSGRGLGVEEFLSRRNHRSKDTAAHNRYVPVGNCSCVCLQSEGRAHTLTELRECDQCTEYAFLSV